MSSCDNCGQPIKTMGETHLLCKACTTLSEQKNPICVSPMGSDDLELVLAWRSNPKIYRHFRRQDDPLDWEEHLSWYESRDNDRHDFIIHYKNRRVGVVSITASDKISIYLGDFSAHGQGVATAALNWLCEQFKHRSPLIAEIHDENDASKRLFERCGFQPLRHDGDWIEYSYES